MDRRRLDTIARDLGTSRSRRQVLGTAAKGTIGGVGAALLARGFGQSLADNEIVPGAEARQVTSCAAPAGVKVRIDIFDLQQNAERLRSLRRGVTVMQSRTESDPTSWTFQANLHAVPAVAVPKPTWCQHASWFFLPWHRMYLYWFEQILREASGDPDLTLPYWNYSDDVAQQFLPAAMRAPNAPDGSRNSLFESRRERLINQGWGLPASAVDTTSALALKNFFHEEGIPGAESFGGARTVSPNFYTTQANVGRLEARPHGPIHNSVGGPGGSFSHTFSTAGTFDYRIDQNPNLAGTVTVTPGDQLSDVAVNIYEEGFDRPDLEITVGTTVKWTNEGAFAHEIASDDGTTFESPSLGPVGYMRSLFISARDPVFWMHHANIDRLWNRWLEDGGSNPPEIETEWMDQEFTFYRPDRSPVTMKVRDVLSVYCLGYRYDDDPETEPAPIEGTPVLIMATPTARVEPRVETRGENSPAEPIALGADRLTTQIALEAQADEALTRVAMIEATPVAGAVSPRIVLTLDGIRDTGSPAVTYEVYVNLPPDAEPDFRGDAFVGLINLFGLAAHANHGVGAQQSFDITSAVHSAQERGDWAGEVTVTIVAQGLVPPEEQAGTPAADAREALTRAAPGPWVTIDRITVATVE
jgi:plastocyanin